MRREGRSSSIGHVDCDAARRMDPTEQHAAEVIIVDDDDEVSALLADILEANGYHVRTASNGREALGLITDHAPELVLLDVDMPILSGPEMAAAMHQRDRGLELIPVVLVSGNVRLADTAAAVGTPYFLAKPYSVDSVLALVARALVERVAPMPSSVHHEARQ
jgi:DNA-binding NtrC family response regulator